MEVLTEIDGWEAFVAQGAAEALRAVGTTWSETG